MKALSIRAPWWWFILHGGKDIENRQWPTRFRGRVLVHASKWWHLENVKYDSQSALCMRGLTLEDSHAEITWKDMRALGGQIVGSVEIVDCVAESASPWFEGGYGFVLRNPVVFAKPIPFKGALGFFNVPDNLTESSE